MKTLPVRSDRFRVAVGARWQRSHTSAALALLLLVLSLPCSADDSGSMSTGAPKRSSAHATVAPAWRDRRLTYSDVLLSTVVAEFNRHNRHQIRLERPIPDAMRLSCSTQAGYPLDLLLFLMAEPSLVVQPDGEDWVVRGLEVALDERE